MRERIYYEINEQSARSAHEMMSFRGGNPIRVGRYSHRLLMR